MTAQLSVRPPWGGTSLLERDKPPTDTFCVDDYPEQRESFLRTVRLRKNLEESRKAFLNLEEQNAVEKPPEPQAAPEKRTQAKKISFKIKKTSSVYRRKDKATSSSISVNTVQELARKYNELVEKNKLGEQPKIARLVKRVNSQIKGAEEKRSVARKPSVKRRPAPESIPAPVRRVGSVTRKASVKKGETVRAKVGFMEGPRSLQKPEVPKRAGKPETCGGVKAAIAIFEQKSSAEKPAIVPKPKVPQKTFDVKDVALKNHEKRLKLEKRLKDNNNKTEQNHAKTDELVVQVVNIPLTPPKKCDSRYETMQLKRTSPQSNAKDTTVVEEKWDETYDFVDVSINSCSANNEQSDQFSDDGGKDHYQVIDTTSDEDQCKPSYLPPSQPPVPPRRVPLHKPQIREKIYEELNLRADNEDDGYEICDSPVSAEENIYETLPSPAKVPPLLPKRQEEPLPPRPPSRNSCPRRAEESESNFYESIYCRKDDETESNYESIYGWKSKRDSIISDQQSNSIYNRSITSWAEEVFSYAGNAGSELSGSSDRSDEWVDLSDHEDSSKNQGFIIVRDRPKACKKPSGWSQQLRDRWNKTPRNMSMDQGDSDSDHHYETLSTDQQPQIQEAHDDDFDSFDSDSESDNSFAKHDSGVDMGNTQLPEPPNQQAYVLTRLAASAGKHMKRLRRNWSLTKNDITKSLSRMTKRKSRTDLDSVEKIKDDKSPGQKPLPTPSSEYESSDYQEGRQRDSNSSSYQNIQFASQEQSDSAEKTKSLSRKGFLNKFRRSMSISGDNPELTLNPDGKPKSTFYLTETIDIDRKEEKRDGVPVVNVTIKSKTSPVRPRVPPPPAPHEISPIAEPRKKKDSKRSTSWYAECGLFKNSEPPPVLGRRPNTFWYAEVGLYRSNPSTPSTSSTENSGSLTNVIIKPPDVHTMNQEDDDYYNMKNDTDYYNESIKSCDSSDTKKDETFNSMSGEMQLRLQDEPLYQFYDAAVLESVCQDGTSDFEYDGYEEVGNKKNMEIRLSARPSAMELVSPSRNNVSVTRTLWCEIPEVIQSAVLSTLSLHQKKLQEAKFEMLTSEASYLNSLNVLTEHFVKKIMASDAVSQEEKEILFGKVIPVKACSEKLLSDLEKCWQENILLHGICETIKKHAEENFYVYVTYCENQILLDRTLKKLKDRTSFTDILKQLECSSVCQLLTLHSFLMLPMQRITRWPLLVDALLKRLSPQDEEYLSCQYALATLNKIVNQCNEGARRMERVTEMQKIATQLEFAKSVPPIALVTGSRWLVRSGPLIQMQARGDDVKHTFGKRFTKVPLHLFLFNDVLMVAKSRGDDNYVIHHYCYRSYLEINSDALSCLPFKDSQGRHLIFLTILENHEEKTIELLLSCNSETDKERWLEALSPPKSENPDETLYECWDCPQVTAVHNYNANQPDELALARGDIINVTRKMADGWFHGERIRDGQTGWFPANYTVEVANPHVRARNLKQRYRLLAFSENYLKSK